MRLPINTCMSSQCMLVAVRHHLIRDGLRSSANYMHKLHASTNSRTTRKCAADKVNTEVPANRVVDAKEGCGAIGQMADNQAIRLSSVLVDNYNVCELVVAACVHELADDLQAFEQQYLKCLPSRWQTMT